MSGIDERVALEHPDGDLDVDGPGFVLDVLGGARWPPRSRRTRRRSRKAVREVMRTSFPVRSEPLRGRGGIISRPSRPRPVPPRRTGPLSRDGFRALRRPALQDVDPVGRTSGWPARLSRTAFSLRGRLTDERPAADAGDRPAEMAVGVFLRPARRMAFGQAGRPRAQ